MKFSLSVGLSLSAATASSFAMGAETAEKPNIVYILTDDLGYGDLGCYGQKDIKTPNIDRLAKEGIRFTQHYSGSTVSAPSRACLLTGKHTGHTFMRGNGKVASRRDPQDIILPRLLKQAGYNSAMIGKSGLACNNQDGKLANDKGFDHFFGHTSHTDAHFYFPKYLWRNGEKVLYPNNKLHEGDHYGPEEVITEALEYVEKQKKGPFFLHLAMQLPHVSLRAPEKFIKMYRGKFGKEKPVKQYHYSGTKEPKATYAAMVTCLDDNVGRLIKKLKELGLEKNTLVIFASDNGPASEGGYRREYMNSNGPLRGGKRDLYEGGIRIPMIAWWPGVIKQNQTSDHISAFWDFMPTACELAGIPAPKDTDGISFVPELLGKEQPKHKYLYWEFFEQGGKQAVRMGKWKAIRMKLHKKSDSAPIELYDLSKDLEEQSNVAAKYPEVVEKMKQLMKEAHTPNPNFKFPFDKKK